MDRLEIRGLRAFGRHGVLDFEQEEGQVFVIDCVLELDLAPAAVGDDLARTVDYGELSGRLAHAVASTRFNLIEALAGHLAGIALEQPAVAAVEVRVGKPQAPLSVHVDDVGVWLRRTRDGAA